MNQRDLPRSTAPPSGRLLIIGGGEDRKRDKTILARFVELSGGRNARIAVLTAASSRPQEMWEMYDEAFGELGVSNHYHVSISNRRDAADPAVVEQVYTADGVFMTGGDQKRLLVAIGGTATDSAMHRAFRERGTCVAGTSAGASAMSEHMLAAGGTGRLPAKGDSSVAAGLGFLRRVVIDQHFSERQRLGRLLGVIAQNPYLLGAGIDENTALLVEKGAGFEVIGEGAVTLIDGRQMLSNFLDIEDDDRIELVNVHLHLLPAGSRHYLRDGDGRAVPDVLREAVAAITSVSNVTDPSYT